jgi:hypothetical protein
MDQRKRKRTDGDPKQKTADHDKRRSIVNHGTNLPADQPILRQSKRLKGISADQTAVSTIHIKDEVEATSSSSGHRAIKQRSNEERNVGNDVETQEFQSRNQQKLIPKNEARQSLAREGTKCTKIRNDATQEEGHEIDDCEKRGIIRGTYQAFDPVHNVSTSEIIKDGEFSSLSSDIS